MAEKAFNNISIGNMAIAVLLSGFVNAVLSFAGLILCMPCMVSDALGSLSLVFFLRRTPGGKSKLPKTQALILGALSGLFGSILFISLLLVIFLAFGNLADMLHGVELLGNSVSGIGTIPVWLVLIGGAFVMLFKMTVSAIAVMALSSLDPF